jgi:DNA-binding transcriptional ArsR family regulator
VEVGLHAISNARRRAMLELLSRGEQPASTLAEHAGLTRPAASQHLKVLLEAGLVEARVKGRQRLYRARVDELEELREKLDAFWNQQLASRRGRFERAPGRTRSA